MKSIKNESTERGLGPPGPLSLSLVTSTAPRTKASAPTQTSFTAMGLPFRVNHEAE